MCSKQLPTSVQRLSLDRRFVGLAPTIRCGLHERLTAFDRASIKAAKLLKSTTHQVGKVRTRCQITCSNTTAHDFSVGIDKSIFAVEESIARLRRCCLYRLHGQFLVTFAAANLTCLCFSTQ